jgi:hypothetical protein
LSNGHERKAALIEIDTVNIPVTDKKRSTEWFVKHFGLVVQGDHLMVGKQDVFLLESDES